MTESTSSSVVLAYAWQSWTTAVHLEHALARRVRCETFGPDAQTSDTTSPAVWVESGRPWVPPAPWLTERATSGAASGAWLIDTHRQMRWRLRAAGAFDHTWFAQRDAALHASRSGLGASWLPLAAPRELAGPGEELADRPFDVAFVGQARPGSGRARVIDALRPRFNVATTSGFVEPPAMMEIYRQARVVINLPLRNDLNMRTFEAAARGPPW